MLSRCFNYELPSTYSYTIALYQITLLRLNTADVNCASQHIIATVGRPQVAQNVALNSTDR